MAWLIIIVTGMVVGGTATSIGYALFKKHRDHVLSRQDTHNLNGTPPAAETVVPPTPAPRTGPQDSIGGAKDSLGVLVTPAGRGVPKQLSFTTGGVGEQEFSFDIRPRRVLFESPSVAVEGSELPKEIDISGNRATVVRFTNKGFVLDDHNVIISGRATLLDAFAERTQVASAGLRVTAFVPDVVLGKPIALHIRYINESDSTVKVYSKYGFMWVEQLPKADDAKAVNQLEELVWKSMVDGRPSAISDTTSVAEKTILSVPPRLEMQVTAFTNIIASTDILDKLDGNSAIYFSGMMHSQNGVRMMRFCARLDRDRKQSVTLCREHN